jgi:hypothetical protein
VDTQKEIQTLTQQKIEEVTRLGRLMEEVREEHKKTLRQVS